MSDQSLLEGFVRTARQRDATDVGQIQIDDKKTKESQVAHKVYARIKN